MLLFSADPGAFLRMPDLLTFWPYVRREDPGRLPLSRHHRGPPGHLGGVAFTRWSRLKTRSGEPLTTALLRARDPPDVVACARSGRGTTTAAGRSSKPYTWLAFLPGFSGLRAPARFAMLATLTLSVAGAPCLSRGSRTHGRGGDQRRPSSCSPGCSWTAGSTPIPLGDPLGRFAARNGDAVVLELPTRRTGGRNHGDVPDDAARPADREWLQRPYAAPSTDLLDRHSARRPVAILHFAEARPLIVVVNSRLRRDDGRRIRRGRCQVRVRTAHRRRAMSFWCRRTPATTISAGGPSAATRAVNYQEQEYVVFDLGGAKIVRTLSFRCAGYFDRFHPRIEVETSLDGRDLDDASGWTGPAAWRSPARSRTRALVPFRIQLPDVRARYLRVHPAPGWMIRELSIHGPR